MLAAALVSTLARLYVRRFMTIRRWALDDYLIMVAMVLVFLMDSNLRHSIAWQV